MKDDLLIDERRRVRMEISEKTNHDPKQLVEYCMNMEKELSKKYNFCESLDNSKQLEEE